MAEGLCQHRDHKGRQCCLADGHTYWTGTRRRPSMHLIDLVGDA